MKVGRVWAINHTAVTWLGSSKFNRNFHRVLSCLSLLRFTCECLKHPVHEIHFLSVIQILPPAASDNSTHSANHCTSASGSTSVVSRPLEWHTWKWVRKWGVRPPVMFASRPTLMLNNYVSIFSFFPTSQQPTKKINKI